MLGATLIVLGVLTPAVLMWWFFLLPPVLALVVLWFGVVKGGFTRKRPAAS